MAQSVLVLGDGRYRGAVTEALEAAGLSAVDCDPQLGDCVMYVKLESVRYDAFVFVGYRNAVTRGALALTAERAVLIPLLAEEPAEVDKLQHGYLFRLPRAMGLQSLEEGGLVDSLFPKAEGVPREVVGNRLEDEQALMRLVNHATAGEWQWATFVDKVAKEVDGSRH